MNQKDKVAVIMGSDSDLQIMKEAVEILKKFGVSYEVKVLSAHRCPEDVAVFAKKAKASGIKVIIAGAGSAAHLAGVIASMTTIPVIGVPVESGALKGLDALLSTVQMPSGIPVATVAINGSKNAGILAVEMLALSDKNLSEKLGLFKKELRNAVKKKNDGIKL